MLSVGVTRETFAVFMQPEFDGAMVSLRYLKPFAYY
jgi:hypothetical protein